MRIFLDIVAKDLVYTSWNEVAFAQIHAVPKAELALSYFRHIEILSAGAPPALSRREVESSTFGWSLLRILSGTDAAAVPLASERFRHK
jgi:hypothetical protein